MMGWPQKLPPATYRPRTEAMKARFASYRAQRPSAVEWWSGGWRYLQPSWWFYGPHRVSRQSSLYHIRGQWWLHHEHAKKWERVP